MARRSRGAAACEGSGSRRRARQRMHMNQGAVIRFEGHPRSSSNVPSAFAVTQSPPPASTLPRRRSPSKGPPMTGKVESLPRGVEPISSVAEVANASARRRGLGSTIIWSSTLCGPASSHACNSDPAHHLRDGTSSRQFGLGPDSTLSICWKRPRETTAELAMLFRSTGGQRVRRWGFRRDVRELNTTPHVAQNVARRGGSAIDGRTTRHVEYGKRVHARILSGPRSARVRPEAGPR